MERMEFLFRGMNDGTSECNFDESATQRCPFLRNINKPTSFSFSLMNFPNPGAKGPIFEDPLAAKTATISLSGFNEPFGFNFFNDRWNKKKSESANKRGHSSKEGSSSKHEAIGNEWLEIGNCPIAKSYRAVSRVLPLITTTPQPPAGMKLKCPPAVVAARAALARTAFVKNLRPQPLPAKMLAVALLGLAANVPLGMWKEHTKKFSLSWFVAVHAAVPFIALLRKSVLMPKTAMTLTIAASIVGQVIGSRAEKHRMMAIAYRDGAKNYF